MAMIAVRGLANEAIYTIVWEGWADVPTDGSISYDGYTWIDKTQSTPQVYIASRAIANDDGTVSFYCMKAFVESGSGSKFNNNATATLYKVLSSNSFEEIREIPISSGEYASDDCTFTPDFTKGSAKYLWLVKTDNNIRFRTEYITVRAKTAEASLKIVGGSYFGSDELNKNDPPKYNVKIKNTGTSAWNGCFYLKTEV